MKSNTIMKNAISTGKKKKETSTILKHFVAYNLLQTKCLCKDNINVL